MPTKSMTLPKLIEEFGSEDACREALEELRWPDGVRCPRCEDAGRRSDRISRVKKRHVFHCDECTYQFSVRVGTVLQDSKLPLWKWFLAVYMMIESKKGVSAKQLQRMLGVSYKTAWFLCHRIREAMKDDDAAPLTGIVEIDETFVGGKKRQPAGERKKNRYGKRPGTFKNKSVVMAAVERDGKVRFGVVRNRSRKEIEKFVEEHTSGDADAFYTDELAAYSEIGRDGVLHETVTHSKDEWVHGQVHTNTVEGVFSLLKRSIAGSYHKVSKKHLDRYLDEIEWRYNNRKNPYLFRDTLLKVIDSGPMEFKRLTAPVR